ncbi:MAG: hypothetical protein COY80_01085 [Candidatus Pacebacteria bacterium CG_4_10_14_0_8_um_filter_42_14]|nr:MAG: hypothetical protein COY80_01085 [Candidatus Pacebacteria bacterium CG_4_10_14_0_8_um_filter_42_14]
MNEKVEPIEALAHLQNGAVDLADPKQAHVIAQAAKHLGQCRETMALVESALTGKKFGPIRNNMERQIDD